MAMTEWQDVGMSGEQQEQLQAIYEQIVLNIDQSNFQPTLLATRTEGSGNVSHTFIEDCKLALIYTATNTKDYTPNLTTDTATIISLVRISGDHVTANEKGNTDVYFLKDIKEGDIVSFDFTTDASQKSGWAVYELVK